MSQYNFSPYPYPVESEEYRYPFGGYPSEYGDYESLSDERQMGFGFHHGFHPGFHPGFHHGFHPFFHFGFHPFFFPFFFPFSPFGFHHRDWF